MQENASPKIIKRTTPAIEEPIITPVRLLLVVSVVELDVWAETGIEVCTGLDVEDAVEVDGAEVGLGVDVSVGLSYRGKHLVVVAGAVPVVVMVTRLTNSCVQVAIRAGLLASDFCSWVSSLVFVTCVVMVLVKVVSVVAVPM